ncbi:hypothetical protein BU15DRAFT_80717 [Melanogaster broomeanus]|nr:hypothetical protein BU15DRAFT_80717 [Melanogaster broomeanus]
MRDTPTEAQNHYQQSSPELPQNANTSSDEEKRHAAEAHRVRFASPEVLNGLPELRGRAKVVDTNDADVDMEDAVERVDSDVMDVEDVDVGRPSGDTTDPGHAHPADDRRLNDVSREPLDASTPPSSQARSLLSTHPIPMPTDSSVLENDVSLLSSRPQSLPPDPSPSPESTPTPQPPRKPSPPPPPKVKMSLKDFALRKKKQREEEMAAKALMSPASSGGHALSPSPGVDCKGDLGGEHCGGGEDREEEEKIGSGDVFEGEDVEPNGAAEAHANDASSARVNGTGVNVEVNGNHHDDTSLPPDPAESEQAVEVESFRATVLTPAPRVSPQLARLLTPPPRASDEGSTQTNGGVHVSPVTLQAKMEVMDDVIPSGLVGIDVGAPDAVSCAPEPPPPPLTTKQVIDDNVAEGSRTTVSLSTFPSTSTSTSTSASTSAFSSRPPSTGIAIFTHPNVAPHAHVPSSSSIRASRRPSHEDGEIPSSTPPKTYLPRSHTPPTQPRSFHAAHSTSPSFVPTSSSSSSTPAPRRPAPPPLSRSPLSNAAGPAPIPLSSRPLPSGPRALRGSMSQPTHPPYPPTRPPYTGSQYIPRGPSADRDRTDWERDRQWVASSRSRGRAGTNGWGR